MPSKFPSIRIIALALVFLPFAQGLAAQSPYAPARIRKGLIGIAPIELTAHGNAWAKRSREAFAALQEAFAGQAGLKAVSGFEVMSAMNAIELWRPFETDSLVDAVVIGKNLRVEAIAVASIAIVEDKATVSLRLYDVESERLIGSVSSSGRAEETASLLAGAARELCAAWASRDAPLARLEAPPAAPAASPAVPMAQPTAPAARPDTPPEAPTAPSAPGPAPREPREARLGAVTLAFLAGYDSIAAMNWELEASYPSLPFSTGLELSYTRIDQFAMPEDCLGLALTGRWWILEGPGRSRIGLSLRAGAGLDFGSRMVGGPFRLGAIWSIPCSPCAQSRFTLEHPLRLQPEFGLTWSSAGFGYWGLFYGLMPYATLKIGI